MSGYDPAGVDVLVVTVNVDEPVPASEAGLNTAVAPFGRPLTLSPTAPVSPAP